MGWEIGSGERFTVNRSSYTPNYSVDRIRPSSILGCFIDCFGPDMTSWFGLWPCSVAGPCSGLPNKHCALGLVKERGPERMEVCNWAMAPRVHGAVFHPQKQALCPRGGIYCGPVAPWSSGRGAVFLPSKRALTWFIVWWPWPRACTGPFSILKNEHCAPGGGYTVAL